MQWQAERGGSQIETAWCRESSKSGRNRNREDGSGRVEKRKPQNVQSHKMLIRLKILRFAKEIERSKSFF
jgi:hypothetical protein